SPVQARRSRDAGDSRNGSFVHCARGHPAFPYPNLARITRNHVLAIRASVATLTLVSNKPPPPQLRWRLNYRVVTCGWIWLFLTPPVHTRSAKERSVQSRRSARRGARRVAVPA